MSHLALQAQINLQVLALKIATRQIGKGVLTTNKQIAFFFNLSVAFSDAISFHSYILIYLLYPICPLIHLFHYPLITLRAFLKSSKLFSMLSYGLQVQLDHLWDCAIFEVPTVVFTQTIVPASLPPPKKKQKTTKNPEW